MLITQQQHRILAFSPIYLTHYGERAMATSRWRLRSDLTDRLHALASTLTGCHSSLDLPDEICQICPLCAATFCQVRAVVVGRYRGFLRMGRGDWLWHLVVCCLWWCFWFHGLYGVSVYSGLCSYIQHIYSNSTIIYYTLLSNYISTAYSLLFFNPWNP